MPTVQTCGSQEEGGGEQKSSIGYHSHPNVFCGMLAPQLVIRNKNVNIKLFISKK